MIGFHFEICNEIVHITTKKDKLIQIIIGTNIFTNFVSFHFLGARTQVAAPASVSLTVASLATDSSGSAVACLIAARVYSQT